MASSINLPPQKDTAASLLWKSQLRTTPVPPPAGLSLAGRTALLTGATTGVGRACAEELLRLGLSRLILGCRDVAKGDSLATELTTLYPQARVEIHKLDMASYRSVQDFAKQCEALERLDLAILNAGVHPSGTMVLAQETGHELSLQVNYLSTVLLSILLLPILREKSPAGIPGRLTIVGSGAALIAAFPNRASDPLLSSFDDPAGWDLARATEAYCSTKLLQHVFLIKLAASIPADSVVVNSVDPGLVKGTGLHRDLSSVVQCVFGLMKWGVGRTPQQGAWTYVDAAVVRGIESHGCFVMDWEIRPFAALLYTEEGKLVMERLWRETMQELNFAGVQKIIDGCKH